MKDYNRLNKKELEFLKKYSENFHEALKVIILKLEGPKLDDPKYWELKNELKKLEEKMNKMQDFVNNHSGY